MVVPKRCGLTAFLLGGLLLLSACLEPARPIVPKIPENRLPHKVAILPFANHSHNKTAGPVLRRMFHNFFSSLNYIDMEQYLIDNQLKQAGLYDDIVRGKTIPAARIGRVLGVDALVFGEVTTFGKLYAVLYSEVRAGLKARMVDCGSGKIIWHCEHTARISEGGISLNPLGLASTATRTLLNLRQVASLRVAADLCREMVATIPNPSGIEPPGPQIRALVHNGAHRLLTPGQKLKVVMVGAKGMKASWEIYPGIRELEMTEKKPGIYVGAYTVGPRDRILSGQISGYLTDPGKGRSQWLDTIGAVTLGEPTRLPAKVSGQLRLTRKSSPYLISDALVVGRKDSLLMEPGTELWVQGLGIVVKGQFTVNGTPADRVSIRERAGKRWKGIILDSATGQVKINGLDLSGARHGLTARNTTLTLDNCRFSDNIWALVLDSCRVTISSSTIRQSEKAGISLRRTKLTMKDSDIVENALYGILIEDSQAEIHHCNILNNGQWNLKIAGKMSRVDARHNHWGTKILDHKAMKISGPATTD